MSSGLASAVKIQQLIRLTRELKPDILHGWLIHGNLAAALSAVFATARVPVLWGVRDSVEYLHSESRATAALIRLGARCSSHPFCIVYNSRLGAREYEKLGYDSRRTRIIPNGFDCDLFRPDVAARESVRRELAVAESATLIGLIARHHPAKDHVNFFRAATALVSSGLDAHFLLAGRGIEKTNPNITAQVSDSGLKGRVHLLGERSDIPRLTAALDLATLCSVAEAFPNSIGEAMACGIPCVATDVGDCRWIIGDTGRVIRPGDSAALLTAWQELLKLSRCEHDSLGEAARNRVCRDFSIGTIARQYESLYLEMLGEDRTLRESGTGIGSK